MDAPEHDSTQCRRIPNWERPPDPIWQVRHEAVELRHRLKRMTIEDLTAFATDPKQTAELDRIIQELGASRKVGALRAAGYLSLARIAAFHRLLSDFRKHLLDVLLRT